LIFIKYTQQNVYVYTVHENTDIDYTGWSKKVSNCQMIKQLYLILLKPVIDIRFIRQIKE